MNIAVLVLVALLGVGAVLLLIKLGRGQNGEYKRFLGYGALGLGAAAVFLAVRFLSPVPPPVEVKPDGTPENTVTTNRPTVEQVHGYVGSAACKDCHAHNHATWYDSYHRTMTQPASAESVLGNFDDVRLAGTDFGARLFKRDGQFFAELQFGDPPSKNAYPVVMTTGSHVRQVYWLAAQSDSS